MKKLLTILVLVTMILSTSNMSFADSTTTLQGTAQLDVQTQLQSSSVWLDGCFLDMPQKEGDVYTTWVIRYPASLGKPYVPSQPVTSRIKVYQYGPTDGDHNPGTTLSGCDMPPSYIPVKLIFDEEITFSKDNPVWAKKFSFPSPTSDSTIYGLQVVTNNNNIVSCSATNTHTRYKDLFTDNKSLPWDYMTSTYGIPQP